MKENQDMEQRILDAIDNSDMNENERQEALLDSEEGLGFLCDIADLEEAAFRKWGSFPDVNEAWDKFESQHLLPKENLEPEDEENGHTRVFHLFRYMVAGIAVVFVFAVFLMWPHVDEGKKMTQTVNSVNVTSSESLSSAIQKEGNVSITYKTITIEAGKQKKVVLPDSTEICLNAKSVLKYPENFGKDNRNVEFYGEGYFKVHHDASLPFIVKTHSISTKVLGTEFNLRCYDKEDVHVTLVQGSVEVSLNKNHVKISPRQDAYVENGKMMVQNVNPKDFTSWKDGILYFDNASLRTILQQLGRVYNVSIVCRDECLLNKHFHYMCNIKDSLEEALKLLNEVSDVNVKFRDNMIIVE